MSIMALLAASFALQAVGQYNEYQTKKDMINIQEKQIDLQKQEQEFKEKIAIREAKAQERQERALLTLRAGATGMSESTTGIGQILASQSSLLGDITNIQQQGDLQQASLNLQEDYLKAQEPSILDLALGIAGTGINTAVSYGSYKASLSKPKTTIPDTELSVNSILGIGD